MIVRARAVHPDRADELDHWYDDVHIPEVCRVPGFVGATRYVVVDRATGEPDADDPEFVTVYELEADDLTEPLRELSARSADGRNHRSDALQLDPPPVVTVCRVLER